MIQIALMAGMFALFAQSQDENLINQFDRKIKIKSASLDSIKIELERGRDRIKELNKKEGSFLEQLEQLEKNIQLSQVYISNISKKIDTIS